MIWLKEKSHKINAKHTWKGPKLCSLALHKAFQHSSKYQLTIIQKDARGQGTSTRRHHIELW